MVNPTEDYEQDKISSSGKQTVIINEVETGETDELDPNFNDPELPNTPVPASGITPNSTALDGEGIDESHAGLDNGADREDDNRSEDVGLNRGPDDDLSLNKSDDDLF